MFCFLSLPRCCFETAAILWLLSTDISVGLQWYSWAPIWPLQGCGFLNNTSSIDACSAVLTLPVALTYSLLQYFPNFFLICFADYLFYSRNISVATHYLRINVHQHYKDKIIKKIINKTGNFGLIL